MQNSCQIWNRPGSVLIRPGMAGVPTPARGNHAEAPIVKAYLCAERTWGAKKKGKGEFPARVTRVGCKIKDGGRYMFTHDVNEALRNDWFG